MLRRLFYGGLLTGSLAMVLFVLGFVSLQFGLTFLMSSLYLIASKVMLLALAVLALLGVVRIFLTIYRELCVFFSPESKVLRQLLCVQICSRDLEWQKGAESRQLSYLHRLERQRLLAVDNRKQARALSAAIDAELQQIKAQLSAANYKTLRKDLRKYRKQADSAALLTLRQQLHAAD